MAWHFKPTLFLLADPCSWQVVDRIEVIWTFGSLKTAWVSSLPQIELTALKMLFCAFECVYKTSPKFLMQLPVPFLCMRQNGLTWMKMMILWSSLSLLAFVGQFGWSGCWPASRSSQAAGMREKLEKEWREFHNMFYAPVRMTNDQLVILWVHVKMHNSIQRWNYLHLFLRLVRIHLLGTHNLKCLNYHSWTLIFELMQNFQCKNNTYFGGRVKIE